MIKSIENNKKVRAVLAVALAVAVAVLCLGCFGIRYQTNDDATLSNIAAGGYGGDTLHMVYVNVLFSAMLRPLYAVRQANWYVIVQLVLVTVSLAVTAYILMKKLGLVAGVMAAAGLFAACGRHIFYSFQYTECAFIMLAAGLLLITDNLGNINKATLGGILLVLFGSMVRWDAFYAVGGLSAALLLYSFFRLDRDGMKKAVLTMAAMFAIVFGAKIADVMAYRLNPAWNEFTQYNAARTAYSDFAVYGLGEENPFADYGVTDIDYEMLNNWDFYDRERFTTQLLNSISSADRAFSLPQLIKNSAKQIKDMLTGETYNIRFMAVILLSIAAFKFNGAALAMAGMYSTFGLFIIYLTYKMRFTSWVELGLIWTVAVFALYCIGNMDTAALFRNRANGLFLAVLLAVSLPACSQLRADAPVYAQWTTLEQEYFHRMSQDKDHIYLLATEAINVAAGFDVASPRTNNFYSNIVAYGGWLSRAPHRDSALAAYGLRRPLVDAVDNPLVYLDYHHIDDVVRYVQQELGVPVYAVKTGTNAFAPYQLTTTAPQQ